MSFEFGNVNATIASMFQRLQNRQHAPFEKAFKDRNYESLKQILFSDDNFKKLFDLYRSKIVLVKRTHGKTTKSDNKSELVRNNGNQLLPYCDDKLERMFIVMYTYDIALSCAETPEKKAKAYGNISAIYFRLNLIPQTLKSIECAMNFGGKSDDKFISKLQERKLRCQDFIEVDRDPAKLSFPSHPNIPGLAGVLKLREKSIFTEKPLKCGDIIAMTNSFCSLHEFIIRRQFCNECGDRTSGAKIPCDFCNTTLFCGESCKAKALQGFHGMECESFSDILTTLDNDSTKYYALKIALKAMSLESYSSFEEPADNFTCFDWKKGDENQDMIILKTILSMKKADLTLKQLFPVVSYYVMLMERVKYNKRLQSFINGIDDGEKRLFDMFCKAYLVVSQNLFCIDFTLNIDWLFGNFQHSCKPNVIIIRDSKLGTNNYVVIDDIGANQELTVAYG